MLQESHLISLYAGNTLLVSEDVSVCVKNSVCFYIAESGSAAIFKNNNNKPTPPKQQKNYTLSVCERCRVTFVLKIFILSNWQFLNYRDFGEKTKQNRHESRKSLNMVSELIK